MIGNGGELGYWLARRFWGRGYAAEAAAAVLNAHFIDPNLGDVESGHYVGNQASGRVLTKIGFRHIETINWQAQSTGQVQQLIRVRLSRLDWPTRQLAGMEAKPAPPLA